MIQGGATANFNGNELEKFVFDKIIKKGFEYVEAKSFLLSIESVEKSIFSTQVHIGETIYGTKRKCDLIIYKPEWKENYYKGIKVIECKWQQSKGSVDEKFPYLVLNIQNAPYKTIILLDGEGYKLKAKEWLKSKVSSNLIGVYSMGEFQKELNNGILN